MTHCLISRSMKRVVLGVGVGEAHQTAVVEATAGDLAKEVTCDHRRAPYHSPHKQIYTGKRSWTKATTPALVAAGSTQRNVVVVVVGAYKVVLSLDHPQVHYQCQPRLISTGRRKRMNLMKVTTTRLKSEPALMLEWSLVQDPEFAMDLGFAMNPDPALSLE